MRQIRTAAALLGAVLLLLFGADRAAAQQSLTTYTITADGVDRCWVVTNIPSVTITVTGIWSGTLTPKAISGGGTVPAAIGHAISVADGSGVTSTTSNAVLAVQNYGYDQLCIGSTAWSSGTASVVATRGFGVSGSVSLSGDITVGDVGITSIAAGDNNIGNVDVASSALPTGAATASNQTTLHGLVGEVQASPTANTLLGRLKSIQDLWATGLAVTGPLTDTQLRASAVPVSLASVPSHAVTNAGTFATQATLQASSANVGDVDVEFNGTAASTGAGAVGTGVQRMTLASDDPAVTTLGATTDSAATAGGNGSVIAQLKVIATKVDAIETALGGTLTVDGDVTANAGTGFNSDVAPGTAFANQPGPVVQVVRDDALTTLSDPDGDLVPLRVTSTGGLWARDENSAAMLTALQAIQTAAQLIDNDQTGASVAYRTSAGSTEDEHQVKGSAGRLFSIAVTNTAATVAYLRCANQVAASTTPGTTAVYFGLAIPGNATGAGFTHSFGPKGIAFSVGLTCWIVTGEADTDVAEVGADDVKVVYAYE